MFKRKRKEECEGNKFKAFKEDDQEEIKLRLKNFMSKNKLTKDNVWHNDFIDDFHRMIANYSEMDWIFNANGLETSTKIYGMRIGSLLENLVQTNRSLTVSKDTQKEPNVNQIPRKLLTKRKNCKTVVQNPDILNKPLEVHSTHFNIISATVGHRSKDMLTNLLNSRDSALTFPDKSTSFWNSNPYHEQNNNYNCLAGIDDIKNPGAIRSSLETYRISACPLENDFAITTVNLLDDDVVMEEPEISYSKSFVNYTHDSGFSELTLATHSDIDDDDDAVMDIQNNSLNDTTYIHDQSEEYSMEPLTSEKFEYSYQSQELIENHWAGPNYWKFHQKHACVTHSDCKKLKKHDSSGGIYLEDIFRNKNNGNDCLMQALTEPLHITRTTIPFRRQTLPVDHMIPSNFTDRFDTSQNLDIDAPIINEIYDPSQSFDYSDNLDLTLVDMQLTQDIDFPALEENSQRNFNSMISQMQRKKVINIKTIKNMTKTVLENEQILNGSSTMLFSEIAMKSLKMLEETHASTALIFQAILHQANEKTVQIYSEFGNIGDFYVSLK